MKPIKPHQVTPVPSGDLPPAPPNPEAQKARCFDPKWKYTPKDGSDIRKTFARIQRQLKENEAALKVNAATVCDLKRKAAK